MLKIFTKYKILFILFFILELSLFIFIYREKENRIANYLTEKTNDFQIQYNTIYNFYKQSSQNIFNVIINKPSVIFILEYLQYGQNLNEKDTIRQKLYEHLKTDYKYLTTLGIKQLHFHLPNNESFLRFHKPELYGDDLTNIRYSVKYVNKFKKPIDGLEEGRVIHGFRFVFPLFSTTNKYLGSVETSVLSEAFKEQIKKNFDVNLRFLIKKDVALKKLLEVPKNTYQQSIEDERYFYVLSNNTSPIENLSTQTKQLIKQNIDTKKAFSIACCKQSNKLVVTFLPIKNIETQENIAYFVAYKKSNYLEEINITYLITLIIFTLLNLFFSYFVYKVTDKKRFLEKKILQSKKELRQLNKKLKSQIQLEVQKNKENEQIILHQTKMATMGEMMENIAHQWKQPLNSISIATSNMILESELGVLSNESALQEANLILDSSKFLANTIQDFKEYFKTDNQLEKINLQECIDKTVKLVLATLHQKGIEVIIHTSDQDIYLVKGLFTQVLLNLINNAKDALIENKNFNNRYIFIKTIITKDTVDIKIKDNAGGISEDIMEHIFEQYFTTKELDGTGIGLHMSRKIIQENMNGTIYAQNVEFHVNNILNKGAEFCISFQINNKPIKCI